jgi:hypothetical protein
VLHAGEVDHDTRLFSDHPAIVTGRSGDHIAGTKVELRAVIHLDSLMAGHNVANVGGLTAGGSGEWLDVFRPTPSRFKVALPTTPSPILTSSMRPLPAIGRTSSGDWKHFLSSCTICSYRSIDPREPMPC